MKKLIIVSLALAVIVCVQSPGFTEEKGIDEYKTAQACYDTAMQINRRGQPDRDQRTLWGRKLALLDRSIKLEPWFTNAYVPYVKTYLAEPMGHEFHDAKKLEEFIRLLKNGLKYNPQNGDEFYLQLVRLEDKRWGYTTDSLNRSIGYLHQALKEYPKSSKKKEILLSVFSKHEYLGEPEKGIIYLNEIVEMDESGPMDMRALENLIHYYDSEEDFPMLLNVSNKFLDKFGFNKDWSCYSLYCLTLSSNEIGLAEITIENGMNYLRLCNRNNSTTQKIQKFLSNAYLKIGNVELTDKYKKLSE